MSRATTVLGKHFDNAVRSCPADMLGELVSFSDKLVLAGFKRIPNLTEVASSLNNIKKLDARRKALKRLMKKEAR